jgi:hypothetical protein
MSTQPEFEQRYFQSNDVHMRITNSIVRYEKVFYWCAAASTPNDDAALKVRLYNLHNQQFALSVDSNSPELDVTSPELGWMYLESKLSYIARAPYRKQKQGAAGENLVYYMLNSEGHPTTPSRIPNEYIFSENFGEMLNRKKLAYKPAFSTAFRYVGKTTVPNGSPVSLQHALLAVGKEVRLYRRLTAIGTATAEGVDLYPEHRTTLNTMNLIELGVPLV